ncbi:MAG TPA: DUF4178 domain-containing protein [Gemmatimonadaceae bacterium]|jgi:hypothetical protein|nr:DUF4178 domain-containing protein [Gemmatimonadaceae bacterium]
MAAPRVAALDCPNCGAAITIRAVQQTQTVVCASCHAVLDSRDQQLSILQQYQAKLTWNPDIPLGTRGMLRGDPWEVTGFQVRSVRQDDAEYFWREYTLWNPYKGYRYLMEYDGHWCDFDMTRAAPPEEVSGRQPFVRYDGQEFRHYRTTTVTTVYILGEFPWQLRSGDRITSRDFIAPPRILSQEISSGSTVWALGNYVPAEAIWRAFERPGAPPPARGQFFAEPNILRPRAIRLGKFSGMCAVPIFLALLLRHHWAPARSVFATQTPYVLALIVCALPAAFTAWTASQFENVRWAGSDYAPEES